MENLEVKSLKDLTPAQALTLAFFVSELTNEFRQIETALFLECGIKLRHDVEEFKEFFEAFKKFGQKMLEVVEHKTENHFKEGKEANNE